MTRLRDIDSQQTGQRSIDCQLAEDVMRREVVTVRESDTVSEVELIISDAGVSGVPVLAADGRVSGVVSMRDLIDQRAAGDPLPLPLPTVDENGNDSHIAVSRPAAGEPRAADLMSPTIESTHPETDLRTVARQMVDRSVHRVLVVENGKLRGIISTFDILRAFAR